MSGVDVIVGDLSEHPRCPHGPTLLFSRTVNGVKRNFFACSACRDRKLCSFFLYEDERDKYNEKVWDEEAKRLRREINHPELFLALNQIKQLPLNERRYCHTCSCFLVKKFSSKHNGHDLITNVSDHNLTYPSEFLRPLEDAKKEAQFLFSKQSVEVIVSIFQQLQYKKVISMGTPRIHEFIKDQCPLVESLLLDIDKRYHNFYGDSEFCWYNSFNHHFFNPQAERVFLHFIKTKKLVLVLDPPFGGRIEPLAQTIETINKLYKQANKCKANLAIFWVFPYFMEPQILNSLPNFTMLDYKVEYDNHPLFQDGAKSRKFGSPVRIFTNVDASLVRLPEPDYRHCEVCNRWVSRENQHCQACNSCTSKDGRTYEHCFKCGRCVKPSWQHCGACGRCAQADHKCGKFEFRQECFHCKKLGHKKRECPEIDRMELHKKRKLAVAKAKSKKKIKLG